MEPSLFDPLASSIASVPGNASPLPSPLSPLQTVPAALYFLVPLCAIVIALFALSHRRTLTVVPQTKRKRQRSTACCYFSISFLAILSTLAGAVGLKLGDSDDGSLAEAGEIIHAFLVFKVGISLVYLANIHLPAPFRKFTSVATLYSLSLFITLSTGTLFSLLSAFILLPVLIPPIMLLGFTTGAIVLLLYTIRAFIVPPKSCKEQAEAHHMHHRSRSGIPYDSIYESQDDPAEQERGIALPVLSDGLPSPSASSMSFTEKRESANSASRMLYSPESHTPLTRQYARQATSTQNAAENLSGSLPRQNPDIRAARARAWRILLLLLLAELCLLVSAVLMLFLSVFQVSLSTRLEALLRIVQSACEVLSVGGVMVCYLLHAYNAAYPSTFARPMLSYTPRQRAAARTRSPYPTSPTSPSPLITSFPLSAPPKARVTPPKKVPAEPKASGLSSPQSRSIFGRSRSLYARGRGIQSVSSSFSSPFPRSFRASIGAGKEIAAATTGMNDGQGWREVEDDPEVTVDVAEGRRGFDLPLSGEPSSSRVQIQSPVAPGSPLSREIERARTPLPHGAVPATESSPSSGMKRRTSKLMKSRPLSSIHLPGQKVRSTLRRRGTRLPGHIRGSSSPTSPVSPITQMHVPTPRARAPTIRSIDSEDFTDLRDPFAPPTPGTVPASIGMRMSQASSDSPLVFSSESLPSTSTTSLRSATRGQRMSAWGRLPPLPMPVPSPNAPHPARSLKGVKGVVSGWRKGRGRTKSGSSSVVSSLKGRGRKVEEEEEVWGTKVDMAEGVTKDGVLEEALLAQRLLRRLDGAGSPVVGGHSRGGSSTI